MFPRFNEFKWSNIMKRNNKYLVTVLAAVSVLAFGAFAVSEAHESSKDRYGAAGGYMGGQMGGGMGMGGAYMSKGGHMGMRMGGGHGSSAEMWEHMDTDKDGTITKEEISKVLRDRIAKFDTNNDGKLSLSEFQGLWTDQMKERIVDHFQAIDNDGDAAVTVEEFSAISRRMTDMFDRNGDGSITKDELRGRHHGSDSDDDDDHGKRMRRGHR